MPSVPLRSWHSFALLMLPLLLGQALVGPALLTAQEPNPQAALGQGKPGAQVELALTTRDGASVPYLLYLPQDYDGEKPLPLLLFLHGRGESYGPLSLVAKWGPPQMIARGEHFPMIVVSPQCPGNDSWNRPTQQQRIVELLEALTTTYRIDPERVYLSGLSMGGYGSWRLAADHPERFAAAVIICGGGDPADAAKLTRLPIWVFHGDQDAAVPVVKSQEMVDAIRAAGGESIRYTTLEHVGHNSWSPAYALPDLYAWLLAQKRPTP